MTKAQRLCHRLCTAAPCAGPLKQAHTVPYLSKIKQHPIHSTSLCTHLDVRQGQRLLIQEAVRVRVGVLPKSCGGRAGGKSEA